MVEENGLLEIAQSGFIRSTETTSTSTVLPVLETWRCDLVNALPFQTRYFFVKQGV